MIHERLQQRHFRRGGVRSNPDSAGARVCFSGSRDFQNLGLVSVVLDSFDPDTVIVHGGARGIDEEAGAQAEAKNLEVEEWPADWDKHGKSAGPIRNRAMLETCDFLYAFWDGQSRGTANAIRAARKLGVPYEVILDVEGV